jgi:spermidine synthase
LRYSKYPIFALHLLSGLTIAMLASLLIYFKQKPVLHHAFMLLSILAIYISFHFIRSNFKSLHWVFTTLSFVAICIICWLGPQFLYQVRPYTFFISGITIGLAAIMAAACILPDGNITIALPNKIFMMLLGYLVGLQVPLPVLQMVAAGLLLIIIIHYIIRMERRTGFVAVILGTYVLSMGLFIRFSSPILFFEEQSTYEDKVLFATETQYHNLVVTRWHDDHWFFIDQLKNVSSIDEYLYYEPMVHSLFSLNDQIEKVLVLGGENGCLIREVLKFPAVTQIHVVHYDSTLGSLGRNNHFFTSMNLGALNDEKVTPIADDLLDYISGSSRKYDAIFIDLPDPRTIETNQFYTLEFYRLIGELLENNGVMITQAGSPYFASEAFYTIGETIRAAGFHTLPMHNQILTLGEWGWYVGSVEWTEQTLKEKIISAKPMADTRWWNSEAARMVTSFGKTYLDSITVEINTLENPLVYQYYLKGNWDMN